MQEYNLVIDLRIETYMFSTVNCKWGGGVPGLSMNSEMRLCFYFDGREGVEI